MRKLDIGYAMCGSFCTFSKAIKTIQELVSEYNITPVFSDYAGSTDTRFYDIEKFTKQIEEICGNKAIKTIKDAEPIGPQKMFDALIVAPCTGNTLAKLSHGITDTAVTMAVKAHIRNARPVVIGISTNDALGASAENIGRLLARRDYYFIPFSQDDPKNKPRSMVCNFEKTAEALSNALKGRQIQPIIS